MSESIPHYFLYGETQVSEELRFIHCEPIFAHIQEQNWEVKPHRHDTLHQIFLLQKGAILTHLQTREMELPAPRILLIPAGHVHGFKYSDTVEGNMLTISNAFMGSVCATINEPWAERLLQDIITLELDPRTTSDRELVEYVGRIEHEYRSPGLGRIPAIAALLKLVLVHLGRSLAIQQVAAETNPTHIKTFQRFRNLVDTHLTDHWSIAEYCKALGVGERNLSRICRAIVDLSPSLYIQQYLVQEAKTKLVYTGMTVTEVCYEMGFSDPAYFSRFFRKHTGLSPKQYVERCRDTHITST